MKCLCYDQFSWLDLTLTLGEQYATIRETSLLKGTFHERRDGTSSHPCKEGRASRLHVLWKLSHAQTAPSILVRKDAAISYKTSLTQ